MGGKSSNVGTCSVRVERRKRIAIFKPGGREGGGGEKYF